MPFEKGRPKNGSEKASFICVLTGDAKKIVEETRNEFQQKYFKNKKSMELGKNRAVNILLEELHEIKKGK